MLLLGRIIVGPDLHMARADLRIAIGLFLFKNQARVAALGGTAAGLVYQNGATVGGLFAGEGPRDEGASETTSVRASVWSSDFGRLDRVLNADRLKAGLQTAAVSGGADKAARRVDPCRRPRFALQGTGAMFIFYSHLPGRGLVDELCADNGAQTVALAEPRAGCRANLAAEPAR